MRVVLMDGEGRSRWWYDTELVTHEEAMELAEACPFESPFAVREWREDDIDEDLWQEERDSRHPNGVELRSIVGPRPQLGEAGLRPPRRR